MLHRHLNHSNWTLAAIDDVIARGRLEDWKELRDAAAQQTEVLERILRVATPHLSDPYAQRYHFWNFSRSGKPRHTFDDVLAQLESVAGCVLHE